jgi:hypothetical protein
MQSREMYCATCGTVAPFVSPPCPDSHGTDCPEWMCTRCDRAILTDPPPTAGVRRSRRARRPNRPGRTRTTVAA